MPLSKQRRLSSIFTSTFFSRDSEPDAHPVPIIANIDVEGAAHVQPDSFKKVSKAQRRLRTLSTLILQHDAKPPSEHLSQHSPDRSARRAVSTGNTPARNPHEGYSPPNAPLEQDISPPGSASPPARGRYTSLMPPPPFDGLGNLRSVSSPASTQRHENSNKSGQLVKPENKLSKSRWGKSGKSLPGVEPNRPRAWVLAGQEKVAYNTELLKSAEKVPELWDEYGDTYVYLFPRTDSQGPSFKISSMLLAESTPLMQLATSSIDSKPISEESIASERSIDSFPNELHLYFPISLSTDGAIVEANAKLTEDDVETLITARNMFAFLFGQPLVATSLHPTIFTLFLGISKLLTKFDFSNYDGSTFGEAVSLSFSNYIDALHLADVRYSREKTMEAVILGERMRSTELYNEAFAHAVGKYDAIKSMNSPLFSTISVHARNRLERASMELYQRQKAVAVRLGDFDFPSLWSGVAGSTSSLESKVIRFKFWRNAFLEMRKHVMSYYKHLFGSWPPKASSKKNNFMASGLNRIVLMTLYEDFSALYDLLVDRTSHTTRTLESTGVAASTADDPLLITNTLRQILAEYDNSSPPVQPPIPFDIPNIPSRRSLDERHTELPLQEQIKANNKKLKDHEALLLLAKSHNTNSTLDVKRPFIESFKAFESKAARHGNTMDAADQRYGHWLFMYVVLQSLPLLVVDAPGVQFNEAVEYFLCAPPRGGLPWMEQDQRAWFAVAGGAGMVELPKDIVEYGVVATYQRSHCWLVAEQWTLQGPEASDAEGNDLSGFGMGSSQEGDEGDMPNFDDHEPPYSPLEPPPTFMESRPNSRGSDRSRRSNNASPRLSILNNSRPRSIFYGLEQLPFDASSQGAGSRMSGRWSPDLMPPPAIGGGEGRNSRPSSIIMTEKSGISFDDILGGMESPNSGKTKKDKKKK